MSDTLQVFAQVNQRINLFEKKVDAILLRLEILQKIMEKSIAEKGKTILQNPLQQYLANESEVESFRSSPTNRIKEDIMLLQSQHPSLFDQRLSTRYFKNQVKENIMDSKSFGTIKRSILINSSQIEHMKQRILSFEQQYMAKIITLEEGVQILARLCCLIDKKVANIPPQNQLKRPQRRQKSLKNNKAYESHKLAQKYLRNQLIDKAELSSSPIFKYL